MIKQLGKTTSLGHLRTMTETAARYVEAFKGLQDEICTGLEALDGTGRFKEDLWQRPEGGGGRSRVITGDLIEKGGVNFSAVEGKLSAAAGKALGTGAGEFLATGVSIVLHPKNPWVPIIHMNVRYFEMGVDRWWIGGGIDLTPHYVNSKLAAVFHNRLRKTCDEHVCGDYPSFKQHADDYFFIKHRNETRGIGGIFYDRISKPDRDSALSFSLDVGKTFVPAYADQAEQFRNTPYGERELNWQAMRRGRYVEFNLVWDRGTKFGLETNGRTESILMSMPPRAQWEYDHQVDPGSAEAETLSLLRKGVDW